MRSRLAKKIGARLSCLALSLPLTISYAKPSFYRQDVGRQRLLLAHRMRSKLGVSRDVANYMTRKHWPSTFASEEQ